MKEILLWGTLPLLLVAQLSAAQTSQQASAPKKFSASYSLSDLAFQGTKDQKIGLYGFDRISVQAQNFQLTYNISPQWNFLLMANYLNNSVETRIFGSRFRDSTDGFGDTMALFNRMHFFSPTTFFVGQLGLSLPTGSITKKNKNVPNQNYAYNMQLGSGTVDPIAGGNMVHLAGKWTWNSSLLAFLRTSKNSQGYKLGNDYQVRAGVDYAAYGNYLKPEIKGLYRSRDPILGEDQTFGRNVFTEYYHHVQANWDLSLGLKSVIPLNQQMNLGLSASTPLAQGIRNYDDVVVDTRYSVSASVSGKF